jgi:inner membrane protein
MLAPRAAARRILVVLLLAALAACTLAGFLRPGSLLALMALAGLLAWIERARRRKDPGHRGRTSLAAGLAVALAFVGVQAVALHAARAIVAADVARRDPGEHLLDMALSAYPANPLCWSVVTVASDVAHGRYHLRRGFLSIAPGVLPVAACPARIAGAIPAAARELAWVDDVRQDLGTLRKDYAASCHLRAWMRFARAPVLDDGSATDIRWTPAGAPNFSTFRFAERDGAPCPHPVPGWGEPRADLLEER